MSQPAYLRIKLLIESCETYCAVSIFVDKNNKHLYHSEILQKLHHHHHHDRRIRKIMCQCEHYSLDCHWKNCKQSIHVSTHYSGLDGRYFAANIHKFPFWMYETCVFWLKCHCNMSTKITAMVQVVVWGRTGLVDTHICLDEIVFSIWNRFYRQHTNKWQSHCPC